MWILLLALLGCPKTTAKSAVDVVDWTSTPHLPSPSAGTYARVTAEPKDPGVRSLVQEKSWDASLSGAAAALGMQLNYGKPLTAGSVREAVWRAGYPYVVDRARSWSSAEGSPPPSELESALLSVGDHTDIGLVRVRGKGSDRWVLLTAKRRINIGVQPRQVPVGGTITLPQIEGVRYWLSSANGDSEFGSLNIAQPITLTEEGEWLFGVEVNNDVVAKFPIYAGLVPPDSPVFVSTEAAPSNEQDALDKADAIFRLIRDVYGRSMWKADPLLEGAARAALTDKSIGGENAGSFGFEPGKLVRIECSGKTIQSCVEPKLWEISSRGALVGTSTHYGLALEQTPKSWHLVVLIGEESL